ncbi:MAG: prenyltransferase, partial [Candidatus Omnitrophica bacterium]|nr:prenyltransferase [Candidatus Omnitrophota bacterium]
ISAITLHLSANLINDYYDSKSGCDWQDKKFYKFFGGSKLIQEKILEESFYLRTSIIFLTISFISMMSIYFYIKSYFLILIYILVIILSWQYSQGPLKLSYRCWGEITIFFLFGPILVMGGYFIQSKIFPHMKSFLLSLPFGLLTLSILFVNELADYPDDIKVNKNTLVNLIKDKFAFIFYFFIMLVTLLFIVLSIFLGYLKIYALLSFVSIFLIYRAGKIIKNFYNDKDKLILSSKITIFLHNFISIILILSIR